MLETQIVSAVEDVVTVKLPTNSGEFQLSAFAIGGQSEPLLALTLGNLYQASDVPVRVHSSCLTGDVFGSERCDCGPQLQFAMNYIAKRGTGMVIYLHQEGRGIGLFKKLQAYKLQEGGLDTVEANLALGLPADCREYSGAIAIIKYWSIQSIQLLTNNPEKTACLIQSGVDVSATIPVTIEPNPNNINYLTTKVKKMGHAIHSLQTALDIR